jgi:hypothetical protein
MGIYDFFKGTCPHCGDQIDSYNGQKCGSIQTKMFWPVPEHCFRDFMPGERVPFAPPDYMKRFCVGTTACCDTLIDAIFEEDLLVRYEVSKD